MHIAVLAFALITLGQLFPVLLPQRFPVEVREAIRKAGLNWHEPVRVIEHFEAEGDPQKLKAAYYLIENMDGHGYVSFGLYDKDGIEVDFDPLRLGDYKMARSAISAIEKERGETDFKKKASYKDLNTITSDYLIADIDEAFEAWRGRPWGRKVSFEDFLQYILPYRGTNEPLETWRPHFMERYRDLPLKMKDPEDLREAASMINTDLKSLFAFDELFYLHPTDQGFNEIMTTRRGRCEDLSNLAMYAMRANAIPVTSDYTPHWPDRGNNHMWNALVLPGGDSVPFMGGLDNPGEYGLTTLMAKAYRSTYSIQRDSLDFKKGADEALPGRLAGRHYTDVTRLYTQVIDVHIPIAKKPPAEVLHVYLSVFNAGQWKAVQWAEIKEGRAVFKDMGMNIVYLPEFYINGKLVPAAVPFILDNKGAVTSLDAAGDNSSEIAISFLTPPSGAPEAGKIHLEKGKDYEFFYWREEWVSIGKKTAGDRPLVFDKVPSGGLYWVVGDNETRETTRIFTYDNGTVRWW